MKQRKRLVLALALALALAGCHRAQEGATTVVVQIDVRCADEAASFEKTYTSPVKMSQTLDGLRQIGQKVALREEPPAQTPEYEVFLIHSDGSRTLWQLRGDRYVRQAPGPWQQASPDGIAALDWLFQTTTADPQS